KNDALNPENFESQRERIADYVKRKPVASWEQQLPNDGDYLTHSAEIKVPALPHGAYIIIASAKPDFPVDTNIISEGNLIVSELSNTSRRLENGYEEILVLNKKTGAPMAGITANVWQQEYSYITRRYGYKKLETLKSTAAGFIMIAPRSSNGASYVVELISGKNRSFTENFYLYKYYREPKKMREQTIFFTDRSIYRPGQTVYFKAIMLQTDGDKHSLLVNRKSSVSLIDANYQNAGNLELTSNKYGSITGSFVLPLSGVTGQYHLQGDHGSEYFSVEEYKRPKFEVKTNPVKGSFRLNEKIEVTGTAKTYSGAVVDNAEVQYRVVRNVSYPWWWYQWYRGGWSRGAEAEIASGKVMTNDTGGYVIPFTALPDRTISRKSSPTFNYTVYIDVTDQSGETQSTQSYVNVGYKALNVSIGVGEQYSQQDTSGISISVSNLMGTPEAAQVQLSVVKLTAPERSYRERLTPECDKQLYTEAEWFAMFPNDPYKDENLIRNWKQGESVFTKSIASDKEKRVKLTGKEKWKPGVYRIDAITKDKFGEEVKESRYFTLFSETSKVAPESEKPFWFEPLNTDCKPGDKAVFLMGTTAKDVQVLYEIEHQNQTVSRQWMKLSNEQTRIEIPVEEKHRGNFAVHVLMMVNGRVFHQDQQIYVGWESKALDISFATFRDKLQPGKPEEWKLTVKGLKGEKMMAEMVAAMYDASLDAFRSHGWGFGLWRSSYSTHYWNTSNTSRTRNSSFWMGEGWYTGLSYDFREYDKLNMFGFYLGGGYGWGYGSGDLRFNLGALPGVMADSAVLEESTGTEDLKKSAPDAPKPTKALERKESNSLTQANGNASAEQQQLEDKNKQDQSGEEISALDGAGGLTQVKARTNLGETAFFFPQLETDAEGNVVLKFTAPEALTRWRFMAFAHTEDLHYTQVSREVVTQKELMVMPNVPRFLRENDKVTITAKIANLADKDLSGTAQLMLFDALSMQPIDAKLGNANATVTFAAKKGQSTAAAWSLSIPEGLGAVQYRIVAIAGNFSDGEEAALPVLSNRMLVTETLPLPINGGQTKDFRFEKLLASGKGSSTLRSHRLTLEFTSNPAWYGIQSLPYLMEYPYECAEQTFSRFYANSIATHVANSSPKIRAVFDAWKNQSPDAFLSNLEKNQELKALMLEETPWVLQANDESERKRRVGMLFEVNRMAAEQERSLRQLRKMQVSNGGWAWFDGMPDDRYITQHIITGMGHLDHLGIKSVREDNKTWDMVRDGVRYLDNRIVEDYRDIRKYDKDYKKNNHLDYLQVQYLYARSYFADIEMNKDVKEAFDYFFAQSQQYWLKQPRYMQGMLALAQHRYADKKTPVSIMKSLKETALTSEEMGMYWKESSGWYWYQAPIEAQA
ncbi:MAG: alpha-2-macroglobulin family protein, partial [Bacteroidia bacterium]